MNSSPSEEIVVTDEPLQSLEKGPVQEAVASTSRAIKLTIDTFEEVERSPKRTKVIREELVLSDLIQTFEEKLKSIKPDPWFESFIIDEVRGEFKGDVA